jgi:hypothetical protein
MNKERFCEKHMLYFSNFGNAVFGKKGVKMTLFEKISAGIHPI